MTEKMDKFHRMRGEILEICISLEDELNEFISEYFCYPIYHRVVELRHFVIIGMSFNNKIEIFEEICKSEKPNVEGFTKIIDDLKWIKDNRNKLVHNPFQTFYQKGEPRAYVIGRRGKELRKGKTLHINKDLVEEFDKRASYVRLGMEVIRRKILKSEKRKKEFEIGAKNFKKDGNWWLFD